MAMTVFKHDCPHCGTKSVGFEMLSHVVVTTHPPRSVVDHPIDEFDVFAQCGYCRRCIVAVAFSRSGTSPMEYSRNSSIVTIGQVFPENGIHKVPDNLPEQVNRYFSQALDGLGGNYDAAGAMFRKALDVGLKLKFPDINGVLFKRIETAVARGSLTTELGEWAHHIRFEGNDAVHDDDPYTEEEARDLHVFTDLVMRYLFTLPGMLEERRKQTEEISN